MSKSSSSDSDDDWDLDNVEIQDVTDGKNGFNDEKFKEDDP